SEEIKGHPFFAGLDWSVVAHQKYQPPLIPPRGEVNAADAFDIGSFDEEDTKGIKLTEADQEMYKDFPFVVAERWQSEVAETVFETINLEHDKQEQRRKARGKNKILFDQDEKGTTVSSKGTTSWDYGNGKLWVKGGNCILVKIRDSNKIITLTNPDEIGLKEWVSSLNSAHKRFVELISGVNKKAVRLCGAQNGGAGGT
ncbi:unnamed protein product, partial [Cyprideis torosa]